MKEYGLLAQFASKEEFVKAIIFLKEAGYHRIETVSAQEIEGIEELFNLPERSPYFSGAAFIGAMLGIGTGFSLQWWANVQSFPLNVGGRPLNSWPAFIPITFVLMVLFSAVGLMVAFVAKLPWPRLSHPIFHSSLDLSKRNFSILLLSDDPLYETSVACRLLAQLKPLHLEEIPWD